MQSRRDHKSTHVLPLKSQFRRCEGSPAVVDTLDTFLANFHSFTGGSLQSINWNNVVVAGGSVMACLAPPIVGDGPENLCDWGRPLSKYRGSDVDLFLFGLTANQVRHLLYPMQT
jgi:hypothetical protein